jgi:hypothetical protein
MSTKAIREVIEAYRKTDIPIPERHPKVLAALSEVEAIEKAAHFFNTVDTKDRSAANARRAAEVGALFHAIAKESSP